MRPLCFGLLLLAACGKEEPSNPNSSSSASSAPAWKAATPKEFFESYEAAWARGDWPAFWRHGLAKALKDEIERETKKRQARWSKEPAIWEKDRKEMKLDRDPASYTAEEIFVRSKMRFEEDPRTYTFVSAEEKDGKAYVKVKEKFTKSGREAEETWELVKEDGAWKLLED
jgi:hypothetical protein